MADPRFLSLTRNREENKKLFDQLFLKEDFVTLIAVIDNSLNSTQALIRIQVTNCIKYLIENNQNNPHTLLSFLNQFEQYNNALNPNKKLTSNFYNDFVEHLAKTDLNRLNTILPSILDKLTPEELYNNILKKVFSSSIDLATGSSFEPFNAKKDYSELINALRAMTTHQENMIRAVLKDACKDGNLFLLKNIRDAFPNVYNNFSQSNKSFSTVFSALTTIENDPNPEHKEFIMNQISPFIAGFGHIVSYGGALALAAISSDKSQVTPTLLYEDEQIREYFEIIAKMSGPLNERFVLSGPHWLAGEIQIDQQGNASLFLIDPKGDKVQLSENEKRYFLTEKTISICKKILPNTSIFLAAEKRQNAPAGCSIFALDDVIHLFSVNQSLDPVKYPNGLFDFLQKNSLGKTAIANNEVIISQLPLHLLRTMQSNTLLDIMQKSSENEIPLNKKGITAKEFAHQKMGFFAKPTKEGEKLQNLRLEDKLQKITNKTLHFLMKENIETINAKVNNHTLSSFKNRMEEKLNNDIRKNPTHF